MYLRLEREGFQAQLKAARASVRPGLRLLESLIDAVGGEQLELESSPITGLVPPREDPPWKRRKQAAEG